MFNLHFHEKAKKELEGSIQWYEGQKENLGARFELAVKEVLDDIQKNPELFGFIKRPYRQAVVKEFPYIIVYRIDNRKSIINISAIYHAKRNPKRKFRKLK